MLEIVYAENNEQFLWENNKNILFNAKNRFYECSKLIRIYSKHDEQSANFINVETNFVNTEK